MSFGVLLQSAGRASRLLKALGNERRLAVLCHLAAREHSVNELCRLVGLSQSALSQHLGKLRRDHLVKTRRCAQTVYYSLASPEVIPLLRALAAVYAPGDSQGAGSSETGGEPPGSAQRGSAQRGSAQRGSEGDGGANLASDSPRQRAG